MKYLCAWFLLFPVLLFGQNNKSYHPNLAGEPIDLTGLSFYVEKVVDETGVADGRYGMVYTGMLNNQRDVTFDPSLELDLLGLLRRSYREKDLPSANLVVTYLRLDEEVMLSSERRRVQMELALEMPGADGKVQRYGPRQYNDVSGGLDLTGGNPNALRTGIQTILRELDADVRTGATAISPMEAAIDYSRLPDGALYSMTDYRAGRVDTSIRLEPRVVTSTEIGDFGTFRLAAFDRGEELKRREVREFWAYRHGGTTFLYLQNKYYEIRPGDGGQHFVYVPGGLVDVEAMTKRAALGAGVGGLIGGVLAATVKGAPMEEFFTLDLRTGSLVPHPLPGQPVVSADLGEQIVLLHAGETGEVIAELEGQTYRLGPGAHVRLAGGGKLTLRVADSDAKPRTHSIWPTDGAPALYRVAADERGRIQLTRSSDSDAHQTVAAMQIGR